MNRYDAMDMAFDLVFFVGIWLLMCSIWPLSGQQAAGYIGGIFIGKYLSWKRTQ